MAKQTKKKSKLAEQQPTLEQPARKKRRAKKRRPAVVRQKPLPPPVELEHGDPDPFKLGQTFQNPEGSPLRSESFSTSGEPKPGEPIPAEREQVLREGLDEIGIDDPQPANESTGVTESDGATVAAMLPEIQFDSQDVQDVLEEAFHWLADRFDSAHWELTEKQARMLGRPTAQLLSTLYQRLPEFLTRWCDATPGLAGLCVSGAIVVGPKIARQVALSRERKKLPVANRRPQPAPSRPAGPVGPVGPMEPVAEILDQ